MTLLNIPDAMHPPAHNTYHAQIGARLDPTMQYRQTPADAPTVADLIKPGQYVCTNYNTGPYLVKQVTEHRWNDGASDYIYWSIACGREKFPSFLNEYVATQDRIQHLFGNNKDEVHLLPIGVTHKDTTRWIVANLPRHHTYIQPYGGNLDILTHKVPSPIEIYNDNIGPLRQLRPCLAAIARMPDLNQRLQHTTITNQAPDALMQAHDTPSTLHYIEAAHIQEPNTFADFLNTLTGMIVISGYDSPLYNDLYAGWARLTRRTHADGAQPHTEVLWFSPSCPRLSFSLKP